MKQYQTIYQLMIDQNHDLFKRFYEIHEKYVLDAKKYQEEFNAIGRDIQDVIHDYERRLCGKTESGQYSKFSGNLAEKFWTLIRKDYPKIDFIGIH
jgi:hypothetical protein